MTVGSRGAEARVIEVSLGQALAQSKKRLALLLELLGAAGFPSTGDTSLQANPPADDPQEGSDRR